jgi:hypothetical protein
MTLSALSQLRFRPSEVTAMRTSSEDCSCALALEDHGDHATYNEEAFHYFLALERKRSESSRRPFLLLLVDLDQRSDATARIAPQLGAKLFTSLWDCLRETDLAGWYREGRVAGAVLTHLGDTPLTEEVTRRVEDRVKSAFRRSLPAAITDVLRVRVYQLPSK